MTRIASAILGAILTTAAIPAAASAQGLPVQAVTYADLDLASAAGRQSLDRRVGAAVRRVCGRAWPLDLGAVEEVRRCRAGTFARTAADGRVGQVSVIEVALR